MWVFVVLRKGDSNFGNFSIDRKNVDIALIAYELQPLMESHPEINALMPNQPSHFKD